MKQFWIDLKIFAPKSTYVLIPFFPKTVWSILTCECVWSHSMIFAQRQQCLTLRFSQHIACSLSALTLTGTPKHENLEPSKIKIRPLQIIEQSPVYWEMQRRNRMLREQVERGMDLGRNVSSPARRQAGLKWKGKEFCVYHIQIHSCHSMASLTPKTPKPSPPPVSPQLLPQARGTVLTECFTSGLSLQISHLKRKAVSLYSTCTIPKGLIPNLLLPHPTL